MYQNIFQTVKFYALKHLSMCYVVRNFFYTLKYFSNCYVVSISFLNILRILRKKKLNFFLLVREFLHLLMGPETSLKRRSLEIRGGIKNACIFLMRNIQYMYNLLKKYIGI